jgi:hypothetical protein
LVLGVSAAGNFASLLTLLPSAFFTSGDEPGFAGEPVGEGTGLDVADGEGVAGTGFGTSALGSQAPNTATVAARTVDNIIDLLMIFLIFDSNTRTRAFRFADIHSRMSTAGSFTVYHGQTTDALNTAHLERMSSANLQ